MHTLKHVKSTQIVCEFLQISMVRDISIAWHLNHHLSSTNDFSIFSSNFNSYRIRANITAEKEKLMDRTNSDKALCSIFLLEMYLVTSLQKRNLKQIILSKWEHKHPSCYFAIFASTRRKQLWHDSRSNWVCNITKVAAEYKNFTELQGFWTEFSES